MSSSRGEATRHDGTIVGYFRYDGTVDVAVPAMWKTIEELTDNWRREPILPECPHELTEVTLHTEYGGGFSWPGKVCETCMVVRKGIMPWDEDCKITDDPAPANG